MIGYFKSGKYKAPVNIKGSKDASTTYVTNNVSYGVGGCCMGINGFNNSQYYEDVKILIPYESTNFRLTLKEIESWVSFTNSLGFKCEITDKSVIVPIDTNNTGSVFCEVTVPINTKVAKYLLMVLSILRYMFNRDYRYRQIYETTLKLNKDWANEIPDPMTRLHLAHLAQMDSCTNNTGTVDVYSSYYAIFPAALRKLFNVSGVKLILNPTGIKANGTNGGNINTIFDTPALTVSSTSKELLKLITTKTKENTTELINFVTKNSI